MGYRSYGAYLRGPEWLAFKARWKVVHSTRKRCRDCGKRGYYELHHLSYERLGCEHQGDVVPLCRGCHEKRHAGTRKRKKVRSRV
jgi:hypothetical protein